MKVAVYNCIESKEVNNMQVAQLTELVERKSEWEFSASKDVFCDVGGSELEIESRPALNELISRAKQGEYEIIVANTIYDVDRNVTELLSLIRELAKYEVRFWFEEHQLMASHARDVLQYLHECDVAERAKTGRGIVNGKDVYSFGVILYN